MKRITLSNIYRPLRDLRCKVHVPEEVAAGVRPGVRAMLDLPVAVRAPAFDTARRARRVEYVGV